MTVRESLDLTTFAPAIEQLAAQIDNFSSDEKLIADAAVALCSGIVAMAVFQNAPASSSYGNWEGSLDDHSLSLYSATHQLVFTLESNMFQAAVLTGPSGNTWNVNRSQKGLHVQVVDVTAGSIRNRLIKSDGSIVDPSDISQSVQQLKAEWQEIGRRPESSLPAYVPVGDFIDIDLPDISSLPDVNSPSDPGGSSGGSGGFSPSGGPGSSGGSSSGGAPADFGAFPFPKDMPDAGSGSAGRAGAAAENLLKGAAAVAAAGLVGKVVQAAAGRGREPSRTPPTDRETASLLVAAADSDPVRVNAFPWIIGRGNDCQLVVSSRLVSRKHARFIISDGEICFEDLGSSNGSWVNGEKPTGPVPVYRGDEVKVADVVIAIVEGPEKPKPESGNLPTMMFSIPESSQKTGEFKAIEVPEPAHRSTPPRPSAPPPPPSIAKPPAKASPAPKQAAQPRPVSPPPPPVAKPPAKPVASPPPPPAIEGSDDDYVARAVQAARARTAPPARQHQPSEPATNQRGERQPDNAPGQIKPAAPEDFKRLPSVRWVSFIFGFFFLTENVRLIILSEGAIFQEQRFLIAGASGVAMAFFAFIAGPDRGFFRFLTLVSSGVYVGSRLYHEHQMFLAIISNISAAADNPLLALPLLSIVTAMWISKRAANR